MRDKKNPAARVVGYIRVSTERQVDEGHSLEAQKEKLVAHAVAQGLELVGIETDAGASAGSLNRPGLQRALARLEAGEATGLLVVKLDRLTRSVRDLYELIEVYFKDRFDLLSVSDHIDTRSAAGRMLLNVLMAISQWEREAISERTRAVMQHMKASGQWTGGWPPFGYDAVDGQLVENPHEQSIIAKARALRAEGQSIRKVAAALPRNPNTNKPYAPSAVLRML